MIILGELLLTQPVFVFAVLIAIIFLAPFVFRIFKIPDVAAFIISGIIIGPYGLDILSRDASIDLLGTIGLLYLMFVAGLELEPEKLKVSRQSSIIFGIFTFIFPLSLGLFVCTYLLNLNYEASILVSILFSTHTLVAYPIARKLGVSKDISVLTAIGGTIITDTLVLIILSIITRSFNSESALYQIIQLISFFGLYLFVIFYSFPRIAKWFFRNIKRDRPVHFLFILFMVSISSVLAKLVDVEPIIGAFVAGLALNKSIPKNSLLMHHIDFVGNILFIPVFLIGIGMIINTKILFSGAYLWYVSVILIISALAGKWIAAFMTQKILHFSTIQRNLLFGLTSSHAAATIAVILIGYERKMIDETIFNATMLIILVSSLIASFTTEKYGKKLVVVGLAQREQKRNQRILVPISNPATMSDLVALANSFQSGTSAEPIYLLNVVNDDLRARDNLIKIREILEANVAEFNNLNENIKVITRLDLNVSSGIIRAAKEYMASTIVFGWGGKSTASQKIFGSIFDHLFYSNHNLFACNFQSKISEIDKVVIFFPVNIEHEIAFTSILESIVRIPIKRNASMKFYFHEQSLAKKITYQFQKKNRNKVEMIKYQQAEELSCQYGSNTLNIAFMVRKQSIAFNPLHNSFVRKNIFSNPNGSFIIIVPGFE